MSHGLMSSDGGLLTRLFRGTLGKRGSTSSDSGRSHFVFLLFWVGGVGPGMREGDTTMEFELCSLHLASSNSPEFMYLCSVLYVLGVIRTLQDPVEWVGH